MANNKSFISLTTPFENDREGWEIYPRPQLKRESYMSLCGVWQLFSRLADAETYVGEILVPFVPESRISGIFREKAKDEKYVYRKSFTVKDGFNIGRVLLHFGAVDQIARVSLNGKMLSEHTGGYLPFTVEIGDALQNGENVLEVEVTDTLDTDLAYGKQREKRGGMWYTPISGIWQAVWLESVPAEYIRSLKLTPTLDSITVESAGGAEKKTLVIHAQDKDIEVSYEGDSVTVKLENGRLWSPEDPYLYPITLTCGEDRIESYFALRTVSVEKRKGRPYICLNGKPLFFHGLLDQGYFPDGIYLPKSPKGYEWDVLTMKDLGFNMLRKHIKIEPEIFYYYCDKHGMIVFQDMVNSGKYNYLVDTVLPTVGPRRGVTHKASEKRRMHFENSCRETAELLYNHPSVCYYTIFNEGWGQYDADRIYGEMKKLDPSRIWDSTSGWFSERDSDVKSEHIYFKKVNLKADCEKPLVLSEFGGYSCKIEGHSFNPYNNYGYKSFATSESLTEGLLSLYTQQIIPEIESKGLCAAVLTQLSDVEDETNGMCTYDRQVVKVDRHVMLSVSEMIKKAFEDII